MFILHMKYQDVGYLKLTMELVSFYLYFNVLFIHKTPPTKYIVNVGPTCVLLTSLYALL